VSSFECRYFRFFELAAFVDHMALFAAVVTNGHGDVRAVPRQVSLLAALVALAQLGFGDVLVLLAVPGEVPDLVAVVAHGRADKAVVGVRRRTFHRTVADDVPRLQAVEARRLADELDAIAGHVTVGVAPVTLVLVLLAIAVHVADAVALETPAGVGVVAALFAAAGHVPVAGERAAAGVAAVSRQMSGTVAPVAQHGVAHGSLNSDGGGGGGENVARQETRDARRRDKCPADETDAFHGAS